MKNEIFLGITALGVILGFYGGYLIFSELPEKKDTLIDREFVPPTNILAVTENNGDSYLYLEEIGSPAVRKNFFEKNKMTITNNVTKTDKNKILFPLGTTIVEWNLINNNEEIATVYQKVTVIENPLYTKTNQNNKRIMIDFDDGYSSIYNLGIPILDKYNIKTTQYIICGNIRDFQTAYMSWDNIRSMKESGHSIQSHTMSHLNADTLTEQQIKNEYGKPVLDCFAENSIEGIKTVAFPLSIGWDDPKIVHIIDDFYEFARGSSTNNVFPTHCDKSFINPTQKNCATYTAEDEGELNMFNRYNILGWKHDVKQAELKFDESQMFLEFIKFVNSAQKNTSTETLQIPIVVYHRVVKDNSNINARYQGTSTVLLEAEMKYLADNNFEIYTADDFGYDETNNWITIRPHK